MPKKKKKRNKPHQKEKGVPAKPANTPPNRAITPTLQSYKVEASYSVVVPEQAPLDPREHILLSKSPLRDTKIDDHDPSSDTDN